MSAAHGKPPAGAECSVTFEEIDESNYVEYRSYPSGTWTPCKMSQSVVEHLLATQYAKYVSDVEAASADCAAAVRRLVTKGPPEFLCDVAGLPIPDTDERIDSLWFSSSDSEVSARLKDAPVGEERARLWEEQLSVLASMELAEASS